MDSAKQKNRDIVRKGRYLILTRPENLSDEAGGRLRQVIGLYAALATLRSLVLAVYDLFGPDVHDVDEARRLRAAILADPRFRLPFLASLLAPLSDDAVFEKLIVSLQYENAERTTNHVERQNREYRKRQKSHYRLRTRRSEDALLGQMLFLPRRAPRRHPLGAQTLRPRHRTPMAPTMEVHPAN
jgi:hypothetical protein